ncbi:MAG TPA: helix-turn-helix transcriptional regulator [Tahibacter sp.]|jgi:transcriptional regulator with XRE-family HTH domain|nr:helix-turn-helix transcriptional regulator [Tahibacter sp.]
MSRTGRIEAQFATPAVERQAALLGERVRQARIARGWTQADLAERSRISPQTMLRIEHGNVAVALGAWLGVFERLGMLESFVPKVDALAMLRSGRRRMRRKTSADDGLDF